MNVVLKFKTTLVSILCLIKVGNTILIDVGKLQ